MFEPQAGPRLFALPPGADFPRLLVEGLTRRLEGRPPEAMARVTLYLNTSRMQRRVRDLLAEGGARLMPRLRLVTDLGADPLPGLGASVPPLRRRLELARLVEGLMQQAPDFAPGTAVFDLAESLAELMAEMQDEGVPPEALDRPELAAEHAAHWERSLRFIRIVARYFGPDAEPDPAARQRAMAEALAARWAVAPPPGPVIVAGSTGSRGATGLLLAAVARLPQGAVVLPGFDFDLAPAVWQALDAGPAPAEDHPQYRFRLLLARLGAAADDVGRWRPDPPPSALRNRLISLALRPAPVTDQWLVEGPALGDLGSATQSMTLIEAPDARAEAVAIALVLREAAEQGVTAALVTPDRLLGRRVASALDRWRIRPDDSAGEPLSLSPPGRFLRLVAAMEGQRLAMDRLIGVLKHPLTGTGWGGAAGDGDTDAEPLAGADVSAGRRAHLRHLRALELDLRRHGPAFPDSVTLALWATRDGAEGRTEWAAWLGGLIDGLAVAAEALPLAERVARHLALAGALAAGPGGVLAASGLWQGAAGAEALDAMQGLAAEAGHGGGFTPAAYGALLERLLAALAVREAAVVHPLVAIHGTLESRVGGAELVILGGLNEGIWPAAPAPDPWLSRQMRQRAGLLLPERRIGLAAHDFQLASAAPRVVLSRARRDADAETVASRWLVRLTNLLAGLPAGGGPQALAAMQARGQVWLALAAAAEAPEALLRPTVPEGLRPAPRPAPRPPKEVRPRRLSVTEIKTLIRDPYAIYAKHVLRLSPLDALRPEPDARERGSVLHRIVETFLRARPDHETEAEAARRLIAASETVLEEEVAWPTARRLWRARVARVAARFARDEAGRAALGRPALIEDKHRMDLPVPGGFVLTAKPDRIDLRDDGSVEIFDYKAGGLPTGPEQKAFDKQLLMQAVMARAGAFTPLGPREVAAITHVSLGPEGKVSTRRPEADEIDETLAGITALLARYLLPDQGFTALRDLPKERFPGDYDHLSRLGEWQRPDPPVPEDVG